MARSKKYRMNEVAKLLGTTRQSILRWIQSGRINPRKVSTELTPKKFIYEFNAADVEKVRSLICDGPGRPASSN